MHSPHVHLVAALLLAAALPLSLPVSGLQTQPGPGTFTLIYYTPWPECFLHYNPDGRGWNEIPGSPMQCPTNSSYTCKSWKELTVAGSRVVWVTTDGAGSWDNNGGRNYEVANAGIYQLRDGTITAIKTFPDVCPGTPPCSGHGQCVSGMCVCAANYFGAACSKECSCGRNQHCDAQGACTCDQGWSTCGKGEACTVDTNNDAANCGSCGHACAGPHIVSSVCVNGTCVASCQAGYHSCSDGSCQKECGLPGCDVYALNKCSGNEINTSSSFAGNRWQTPAKGAGSNWRPSYQDYGRLTGYPRVTYTTPKRDIAMVEVIHFAKTATSVECAFGNSSFSSTCIEWFSTTNQTGPLAISLRGSDGSQLMVDVVDFIWQHPVVSKSSGDFRGGQKGAIVEAFGWQHSDIAKECAFLARAGYLGVKFFPVQEQVMSDQPFNNVMNPWYFMYQPVSYRLQGRMGTRDELRAAINQCRQLGVHTYADAVVNHMVGCGNDANPDHRNPGGAGSCTTWGMKNTSADFPPSPSTRGGSFNGSSPFFTQCFTFKPSAGSELPPLQEFPAVPYSSLDFHCERPLNSWSSPLDLNAGWLTGLVDLNTERAYVRQRIADYFTDLLGVGFSGFRVDAAKHMRPPDLGAIFGILKKNLGGSFPDSFVVWLEVLTGGEGDMLLCNPDSGYSYSKGLERELLANGLTEAEVTKIKIWFDAYPKQPDLDCGQLEMNRKAIQNDDADQQSPGSSSRDMGDQGTVLVVAKDVSLHQHFEEKLFASPNGASDNDNDYPIRMVLSSYWLPPDANDYGIPDGNSNCDVCRVTCSTCNLAQSMNRTAAYEADAVAYSTHGRFTRTHRYLGTINAMRSWMHLPPVTEQDLSGV